MPEIIPLRELKNTAAISDLVDKTQEPIYVTKNGRGKMVLMNMDVFDRNFFMQRVYDEVRQAEQDVALGKTVDAKQALERIREVWHIKFTLPFGLRAIWIGSPITSLIGFLIRRPPHRCLMN